MIDLNKLSKNLNSSFLKPWTKFLVDKTASALDPATHGDLEKWQHTLSQIPQGNSSNADLQKSAITIGQADDMLPEDLQCLKQTLLALKPWRKGPFSVHGIDINTEWRSDWKWDRLSPYISPLKGRNVLDIGCGNGYHCFRMLGDGAASVIGIDPMLLFLTQFLAIKKMAGDIPVDLLPLKIEDLPNDITGFDTVFSMGVLYHRRSPIGHIEKLRDLLRRDGELVLETLVIEGGPNECLLPEGRYAKMRNVWFIPTTEMLTTMLKRCGFQDIRIVDSTPTSIQEQRATDWMTFQSLKDFLDPNDHRKTSEGYPAPIRAIVIAKAP